MRRRLLGIALMFALLMTTVLAAGCGGKGAESVMQVYLDAMVKGDYATAYAQLATTTKSKISADDFAKAMTAEAEAKGPIVRYEITKVNTNGAKSTIITVNLYRKKGSEAETSETKDYGFAIDSGVGWRLGWY